MRENSQEKKLIHFGQTDSRDSSGLLNPGFVWCLVLNAIERRQVRFVSSTVNPSFEPGVGHMVMVEVVAFVCGDWQHVIRSPPMSGNNEIRAGPMRRVIISSDKPQPTATSVAGGGSRATDRSYHIFTTFLPTSISPEDRLVNCRKVALVSKRLHCRGTEKRQWRILYYCCLQLKCNQTSQTSN